VLSFSFFPHLLLQVVLGFDSSAAALAHTLREELTGLGVEVRPLMKGASRPYLVEHEAEVPSRTHWKRKLYIWCLSI